MIYVIFDNLTSMPRIASHNKCFEKEKGKILGYKTEVFLTLNGNFFIHMPNL